MIPPRHTSGDHPLAIILSEFAPGEEELTIDSDVALEKGVLELARRRPDVLPELDAAVDLLAEVLDAHDRREAHCVLWSAWWTPLPAAGSHRQWLGYVLDRLRTWQAAAACPPFPEASIVTAKDLAPPRSGSFTDVGTADGAVTDVLRAHEAQVHAWVERRDPRARLALHADLHRVVGRVALATEPGREPPVVDATAAVVLLGRVEQEPGFVIRTAYPEVRLDPARRARHPELVALFSAYFGQDWREVDLGSVWWAERAWNVETDPTDRERTLAALGRLLALDDDEMRRVVDACGSYLQPGLLRRWLEGIRRRSVEMSWPPVEPVDPVRGYAW